MARINKNGQNKPEGINHMNRRLPIIIISAVLLIAAAGGYWLYQNSRQAASQTSDTAATPGTLPLSSPELAITPQARQVVTIEEFGDYQCPPCGNLHPILTSTKKEFGDKVRFVFHHFPLIQIHPNASPAASAAVAAGFQGKFWEMHNLLYENQATWSEVPDIQPLLVSFARTAGLDVDRFVADLKSARTASVIASDVEQGINRGVNSTPTLIINGDKIPFESYTAEKLREEVNRRLATN